MSLSQGCKNVECPTATHFLFSGSCQKCVHQSKSLLSPPLDLLGTTYDCDWIPAKEWSPSRVVTRNNTLAVSVRQAKADSPESVKACVKEFMASDSKRFKPEYIRPIAMCVKFEKHI
jgi:hypothetical protein